MPIAEAIAQPIPDTRPFLLAQQTINLDVSQLLQVGMGWDSFNGTAKAACIDAVGKEQTGGLPLPIGGDLAPTGSVSDLTQVTDHYELAKEANLDVTANGQYGGASANVSYQFFHSVNLSDDNFDAIATSVIAVKSLVAAPPEGKPVIDFNGFGIQSLAGTQTGSVPDSFLTKCGDSYISAVEFGGKLLAHMQIHSTMHSDLQKTALAAGFTYNGGAAKASASITSSNSTKTLEQHNNLHMFVAITGVLLPTPLTLKDYNTLVQQFPTCFNVEVPTEIDPKDPISHSFATACKRTQNPRVVRIYLTRYDQLPTWPDDPQSHKLPYPEKWGNARLLAQKVAALTDLQRTIGNLLSDRQAYWDSKITEKALRQDTRVNSELSIARLALDRCTSDPSTCIIDPTLPDDYDLRFMLPARKDEMKSVEALENLRRKLVTDRENLKYETEIEIKQQSNGNRQPNPNLNPEAAMGNAPINASVFCAPFARGSHGEYWCPRNVAAINQDIRMLTDKTFLKRVKTEIDARVEKWVNRPNGARCAGLQREWGCSMSLPDYNARAYTQYDLTFDQ